jgi:polar amino acid transport system substrate-binding protein
MMRALHPDTSHKGEIEVIGRATVAWVGLLLLTALTCAWLVLSGAGLTGSDTAHPAMQGASDGRGAPLRVGYSIEPPYAYLDASGQVQGESPEALRALLGPLGWPEPVWLHLRFGQLLHELQMGRIDLIASGMFITPQRQRVAAFSRPTAMVSPALLVAPFNPQGLHRLQDIVVRRDLKLAVLSGSVELEAARQAGLHEPRLLVLQEAQHGLSAVQARQADAFMLSGPSLRWAVRLGGNSVGELADPFEAPLLQDQPLIGRPAYAMRLGDARLVQLDEALGQFLGTPAHLALATRYGFSYDEIMPPPALGIPAAGAGSFATGTTSGPALQGRRP